MPLAVVEEVLRLYRDEYFQRGAFSREAVGEASGGGELYMGESSATGLWPSGKGSAPQEAPEAESEEAASGHDTAHRRVKAPVVRRRLLV